MIQVTFQTDVIFHLNAWQYIVLAFSILAFIIVEGYLGFHRSFSPITIRRCFLAGHLVETGGCCLTPQIALAAILSPLFAVGYFYAPLRRIVIAWVLAHFIIILVVLVKLLGSPAHEIVDAAVSSGLAFGTLSFLYYFIYTLCTATLPLDSDYIRSNNLLKKDLRKGDEANSDYRANDDTNKGPDALPGHTSRDNIRDGVHTSLIDPCHA